MIRFAAQDFAPRRFPLAVSVTSMLGMAGNVIATIPLTLLLHSAGWAPSFAGTRLVSLATGVAVWALLPADAPGSGPVRRPLSAWLASARRSAAGRTRRGGPPAPGWASGCTSPACR